VVYNLLFTVKVDRSAHQNQGCVQLVVVAVIIFNEGVRAQDDFMGDTFFFALVVD
jgi:hypothetical protein